MSAADELWRRICADTGLLREAGVDDFRITALCSVPIDEARMYVRRGEGPAQRRAVSDFPDDPLAVADEYVSDFQDDVEVQVYDDYRRMIAEAPIDAVNDFTNLAMHGQDGRATWILTQKSVQAPSNGDMDWEKLPRLVLLLLRC